MHFEQESAFSTKTLRPILPVILPQLITAGVNFSPLMELYF